MGDYQLMCHALVALDVTAAAFVPDTGSAGVLYGTLTGVGIHRDVTDDLSGYNTTTLLHDLLRPLALDS